MVRLLSVVEDLRLISLNIKGEAGFGLPKTARKVFDVVDVDVTGDASKEEGFRNPVRVVGKVTPSTAGSPAETIDTAVPGTNTTPRPSSPSQRLIATTNLRANLLRLVPSKTRASSSGGGRG